MYTPGSEPVVFEVDGFRIGCALCVEANFPPLFAEYERLDVDCVLLSVMVDVAPRARVAQAYGTLYSYWLGYSIPAQFSTTVPSGIVAPGGRWLAQCPADGQPALAVADINLDSTDPDIDVAPPLRPAVAPFGTERALRRPSGIKGSAKRHPHRFLRPPPCPPEPLGEARDPRPAFFRRRTCPARSWPLLETRALALRFDCVS